ncbi:LysE family translocator [Sedimenticola selenatireducens]|uniref:LysE family translocator n=1 Tax=Sedimenticola selenatireducens TaxID=191960 RepID=A0A2N6CV36_9GAMM|nr:LysE family translocator [Sedimenticola selenatireducens]PLX61064.1 MAG: LysE family translocator [Sedimenticola selenatireducens]
MSTEIAIQWILIFGPLAISPGPANILFAASGSSFGIRRSIPFWLGTNMTCIIQSLSIGLGLGYIISTYPVTIEILKYAGVVFLLYLASKFFKLSINEIEAIKPLSFKHGVIVELLNVKYLLIPTIMFTQFYMPEKDGLSQVVFLTALLAVLTMASNLVWVIGGKALTNFIADSNIQKTQGAVFGVMLCVTALWLAVS